MHIAVFGATTGIGREIVHQAIQAGHEITALVRDTSKIKLNDDRLYVVIGDILDINKVEEATAVTDVVICTLEYAPNRPDDVVLRGTENIVHAMQKQGISRLVVVSSMGVGRSINQVSLSFKMLTKTALRKTIEDKEGQEAIVVNTDLDWVIVRPSGLTNGPRTRNYHFGTDTAIEGNQISRADVADFVLKQLTDTTFLHQKPIVTY